MAGSAVPDVERLLGDSGVVQTYEARLPDGRRAVVKRLAAERAATDPIGVRRFERESRLASMLAHPSLPALLASEADWFAVERMEGSLAIATRAARFSSAAAVRKLLRPLFDLLAYIHARGVAHADIKPAHVLFRGETPVLIDFSIAVLAGGDPIAGMEMAGTPAWMAPEQVSGAPGGAQADVWSLCALGLWLLSGTRPFNGSAEEVLAKRRAGLAPEFDFSCVTERDDDLLALLSAGLAEAPFRPTSAQLFNALAVRR